MLEHTLPDTEILAELVWARPAAG